MATASSREDTAQGQAEGRWAPCQPHVAGNFLLPAVSLQDFPCQFPTSLYFLLPPPQLLTGFVVRPHDAHTHFSWPQPGVGSLPCFMNKQLAPGHKAELRPQALGAGPQACCACSLLPLPSCFRVACRGSQPGCWRVGLA